MNESLPTFAGRVKCPYCGYLMPIFYEERALADGVWVKCKGKHCKKMFKIKIDETK